jgi:translation initiation factor 2B subunit (eIF-2B alpha/beta/delta family)
LGVADLKRQEQCENEAHNNGPAFLVVFDRIGREIAQELYVVICDNVIILTLVIQHVESPHAFEEFW